MAAIEKLGAPDELGDEEREAVQHLLFRLADDEFVIAERYTEWQVRAPTLESDLSLSNIAQDELGHARLWYDLLEDFGATESDLIWERPADEWRHSTLAEVPFADGDWADAMVRSFCYDVAEEIRLKALEESSYGRIAGRVEKIQGEEDYHRKHARSWLERLVEEDDGRERVHAATDRLLPHALTLFAPTDDDVEDRIDDLGLRTEPLSAMRERWLDEITEAFDELGITVDDVELPEQYDVHHSQLTLPRPTGRDTEHTDDWQDLYDDFTKTYRELGRDSATRIMKDPDDGE